MTPLLQVLGLERGQVLHLCNDVQYRGIAEIRVSLFEGAQ